tara:strand:- start:4316 stop:4516 length:201 start_codon:yes stop_codon:yes gene_type:complete
MDKDLAQDTDQILHQAKQSIDTLFGDDYARNNPELVSGFMIAASNNKIAAYLSKIECILYDNINKK